MRRFETLLGHLAWPAGGGVQLESSPTTASTAGHAKYSPVSPEFIKQIKAVLKQPTTQLFWAGESSEEVTDELEVHGLDRSHHDSYAPEVVVYPENAVFISPVMMVIMTGW
jgi:hypothetical protein